MNRLKYLIQKLVLRLTCRHQYKCVYLASHTDRKFSGYKEDKPVYIPRRIVGEYDFVCTKCGRKINIPMDMSYQRSHEDAIN